MSNVDDEIDEILSDVYYEGVSDHHAPTGLGNEYRLAITTLLDQKLEEAYKKGYIDGGINTLIKEQL